jgi:hypothetical protein
MGGFMHSPLASGRVARIGAVRRDVLKSLKRAAKLPKIEFLDWLASPEGPAPSASLKVLKTRPITWLAIWSRRALLRQFSFPVPRRHLYVPASTRVKIKALRHYAREHVLENFVETGTYHGDTMAALAPMFYRCFTIEMAPALHAIARQRLYAFENVTCILGDSAMMLPGIVQQLRGPALFWLDAHASGGETFSSGKGPLISELEAIYSGKAAGHVVLIDDARGHDLAAVRRFCAPYAHIVVRNDIARLTPIK